MIQTNKIILFDIDDTLIKSKAKVRILDNNGNVIKILTPSAYNHYKLKPGCTIDFADFEDEEILNKSKFTPFWNTLKNEYAKGINVGIITARGGKDMIRDFLLKNGVDINKNLVFAVGDDIRFNGMVKDKKRQVIEYLSARGYKTFVFFDDNIDNLNESKKVGNKIGVKVHTVKV